MANSFKRSAGPGGTTSLQKLLALPDPLLTFKWVCTALPFGHPLHYVESIDLPFNNIDVGDKIHVAASYFYYPSTHNINAFSMTFYEDSSAATLKWLLGWKSQVKDLSSGLYNLPGDGSSGYKQTIKVQLLDAGNNPVMEASLIGVWPSDTGNLPLNSTDVTGRIVISQNFSIDDQSLEFFY